MSLTAAEQEYLAGQVLGRLATIAPDGVPQNNPVGFHWNADLGTIDIGGHDLPSSRKFRNVAANPLVSFVVDDVPSLRPWRVRGVEIRGEAEAIRESDPLRPGFGRGLIRIRPRRVLSWGVDPASAALNARTVA